MNLNQYSSQSFKNKSLLEKGSLCGCYYCKSIYSSEKITQWVDSEETAICVHCQIDAVIPQPQDMSQDNFLELLVKLHNKQFKS